LSLLCVYARVWLRFEGWIPADADMEREICEPDSSVCVAGGGGGDGRASDWREEAKRRRGERERCFCVLRRLTCQSSIKGSDLSACAKLKQKKGQNKAKTASVHLHGCFKSAQCSCIFLFWLLFFCLLRRLIIFAAWQPT
jgi:hypothetical protein